LNSENLILLMTSPSISPGPRDVAT
jgi:hypothetical protein